MPKVSDAHRAARREQILDAAMSRFAANGFHATGMADVIATAGLSAGAVYSYFRSKDELVGAIVERVLVPASGRFEAILADEPEPDLAEAVRLGVETLEEVAESGPVDIGRTALQAWSEALRDDRVHMIAVGAYSTIRGYYVEIARRAGDAGSLQKGADPEQVGSALYSLVAGFLLQRTLFGNVESATYAAAVRALFGGVTDAEDG